MNEKISKLFEKYKVMSDLITNLQSDTANKEDETNNNDEEDEERASYYDSCDQEFVDGLIEWGCQSKPNLKKES